MSNRNHYTIDPPARSNLAAVGLTTLLYIVFGLALISSGIFCVLLVMGVVHVDPQWLKINSHVSFPALLFLMPGGLGLSSGLLLILEGLRIGGFYNLKQFCYFAMGGSVLFPPLAWLCMGTDGVLDSVSRMVGSIIFGVFAVCFLIALVLSFLPDLGEQLKVGKR
ncbi:MAG: hypothetical protein K2W95_14040 [Candidatus Obscuribacterales bacterium]|nr:hypothetical protein [Candidatus Obscuribacterales bacterium]